MQTDINGGNVLGAVLGGNPTNAVPLALAQASVSIAGTAGTQVALPAEYCCNYIILTGTILGNRVYQVPNTGFWVVFNDTSGAFTVTIQTSGGAGVVVATGKRAVLIADGTDCVRITPDT